MELNRFKEMIRVPGSSEKTLRFAREAAGAELNIVSGASQIWTCSEIDRSQMIAAYGNKNVLVIPNGVDLEFYQHAPPASQDVLSSNCFKILYTGDFSYAPNAAAVDRLCLHLLPRLPPAIGPS